MNRGTVVIVGKGGTGKTAELIKKSAESGIYILVANRKRAEILAKQAQDMKLYIPFPVTLQEWLRSDNRFHSSSIRRDGLLIDDIDSVIEELFRPIDIKTVTLRTPCVITNLDQPTADVVEVIHGYWGTDKYRLERSICSICGAVYEGDGGNYCPNCGAKMDGEERDVGG